MKRYLAAGAIAATLGLGLAAPVGAAGAIPFRAVCPEYRFLTFDQNWEAQGPYYISVSRAALRYIATKQHLSYIPAGARCALAGNVVLPVIYPDGRGGWEYWPGNTGTVYDRLFGGARGVSYNVGRFNCTGQSYDDLGQPVSPDDPNAAVTYESCTHTGVHVGTIVVKFQIH